MALKCPSIITNVDLGFIEFIDCSTINITYDKLGVATITMTVISVNSTPNPSLYLNPTYGKVTFELNVTGIDLRQLPSTTIYEHKYSLVGTGCRT